MACKTNYEEALWKVYSQWNFSQFWIEAEEVVIELRLDQ